MSPFFINKALLGMAGAPKSVKKLRSGDLLVETSCSQHSSLLLTTTALGDIPVKITPHQFLNTSRGVISEGDLVDCSEDELLTELQSQGVVAVRRIMFRRDGVLVPSRSVILTFHSPDLPTDIKAGYLHCVVRPYIPNPVRCFKCQVFGHSQMSCRGSATCARCGLQGHETDSCAADSSCINCKGSHPAYSRSCPKWTEEKEIQRIKTLEKLSYPEARRKVVPPTSGKPSFASVVKATVSQSVQTDISVPPTQSFSLGSQFLLSSPTAVSTGTQSRVSAGAPAPPRKPGKVAPGKGSASSKSSVPALSHPPSSSSTQPKSPRFKAGPKSSKKKYRAKQLQVLRACSSDASVMSVAEDVPGDVDADTPVSRAGGH